VLFLQRAAFYGSLGLNTTQFNQHVIIETNKSTARIFPEVSSGSNCITGVNALHYQGCSWCLDNGSCRAPQQRTTLASHWLASYLPVQVPDHENPEFFKILDRMVQWNTKIIELGQSGLPAPVVTLLRLPFIERMVAETAQLFFMTPLRTGSVDMEPELKASVVY
jgi:magnesium-protoporphyrin IX monomethyl ester (oxidative) cyclase